MKKIDIDSRYPETQETGRDIRPYYAFLTALESIFDLQTTSSLIDVGCADAHLISVCKEKYSKMSVTGIEYFEYHKKYASPHIVKDIIIHDIRDPLPSSLCNKKYDIVVCTELGEHIESQYTDALMNNIKSLMGKYLVMTWSSSGGENERHNDPHHQHLNPLPYNSFIEMMISKSFVLETQLTDTIKTECLNLSDFLPWWRESLTIWTQRSQCQT